MPSDAAYWLVSAPLKRGDQDDLFRSIKTVVTDNTQIGGLELPSLKVSSHELFDEGISSSSWFADDGHGLVFIASRSSSCLNDDEL